ncbi:MAG: winged helix-turn-helix domain-containing protein [Chloroflexota bacterium]|nr:winged helix-turn-helix domain-containing protein [Chloroflexota bacterium]
MEERRLEGGRLLKAGKLSQAEIARQLGVSRATVSAWAKTIEAKGMRGLRKRKAAGSQSKLDGSQKQKLKYMLDRGALANGFPTDRWTLERVRQLIQKRFEISYHPNYLNRLLRNLGYSPQKPLPQAVEQEKALVQAWMQRDWPRIKKVSAARRRSRILG